MKRFLKAIIRFGLFSSYLIHRLTHRTGIAVFFFVVIQLTLMEWTLICIVFLLFPVKASELNKSLYFVFFQEGIVFLAAITCICSYIFGYGLITIPAIAKMVNKCCCIVRIGIERIISNDLVVG